MSRAARLLPLILLPLGLAGAQGTRWRHIGTTTTGNPVYVDPRSVTTKDGIITATVRVTYAEPVQMPGGKVTSTRSTAMFDCATKRVAVKESIFYADEAKGVIVERRVPKQPGFGPIFRSNFSGVALEYLCTPPPPPPPPATPPSPRPPAR